MGSNCRFGLAAAVGRVETISRLTCKPPLVILVLVDGAFIHQFLTPIGQCYDPNTERNACSYKCSKTEKPSQWHHNQLFKVIGNQHASYGILEKDYADDEDPADARDKQKLLFHDCDTAFGAADDALPIAPQFAILNDNDVRSAVFYYRFVQRRPSAVSHVPQRREATQWPTAAVGSEPLSQL